MCNLSELLSIVLDENYDSADTSIPVNCHVLAATFYLMVDTVPKVDQSNNENEECRIVVNNFDK